MKVCEYVTAGCVQLDCQSGRFLRLVIPLFGLYVSGNSVAGKLNGLMTHGHDGWTAK